MLGRCRRYRKGTYEKIQILIHFVRYAGITGLVFGKIGNMVCHSLKLWQTYFFMYYTNPPISITMNSAYQTRDLQETTFFMRRSDMNTLHTPFRYDFVGSFLRPDKLKQARADYEAGAITKEQLTAVEDDCIRDLITKPKPLGYHVITDGEFRLLNLAPRFYVGI